MLAYFAFNTGSLIAWWAYLLDSLNRSFTLNCAGVGGLLLFIGSFPTTVLPFCCLNTIKSPTLPLNPWVTTLFLLVAIFIGLKPAFHYALNQTYSSFLA